ncbi:MAG: DUF2461 domain-containing protein [Actinomycetota bacterium]
MTTFEGIPFAAADFYEDLGHHNSRDWWAVNREVYESQVRAPMAALAAALEDEFGAAKAFRPYRDVRFSPDKTPYKTHQGVVVATGSGMGWYVQVSADGLMTAGGWYSGTPAQLARFRGVVDSAGPGEELRRIVGELRKGGYVIDGDRLKTRPRGFSPDHPRLELLRHRSLIAEAQHGAPEWLPTAATLERVRDDWRAYGPLLEWLDDHVGEG